MKCPACGAEMEPGSVVTQHSIGLFFLPPGAAPGALVQTRKHIEKQGGVVLDGPYNWNLPGNDTALDAHICRKCRKIVMEY